MIDDDFDDDIEDELNDDDHLDKSEYTTNSETTSEQDGIPYNHDDDNMEANSAFEKRTGIIIDTRNLEEILSDEDNISAEKDLDDNAQTLSKVYGTPDTDAKLWHQQDAPDTCAVVSQEYIINSFTGENITEEELALEAMEKDYYQPGIGTYQDSVGNLLEDHGIEVERTDNNTIKDIKTLLDGNHKIIAAVDAYEIWYPSLEEQLKDIFIMPEANHAVMVTGYDDSNEEIILNDPGHPFGKEMKVPLSDFENAWADSNNYAVYTTDAAPLLKA